MTAPPVLPTLTISQIVLEDVQFRHRSDYLTLPPSQPQQETPAAIAVELMTPANDEHKVAAIRIRVSCDDPEALYLYSMSYVVLLSYEGRVPEDFDKRLMVTGGNMAFPYLRELLSSLSGRGRFGATWLAPVNFNEIVNNSPLTHEMIPAP